MPAAFKRTLQTLQRERRLSKTGLAAVAGLLAVWLAWAVLARVSVFEYTPTARLEADRASYPIVAEASGQVVTVDMTIGDLVQAGEVLLQIDATPIGLKREELNARRQASAAELNASHQELQLRRAWLAEVTRTAALATEEARAKYEERRIVANLASSVLARAERLFSEGQLSQLEIEEKQSAAEIAKALATSRWASLARVESEFQATLLGAEAALAELSATVARLSGDVAEADAQLVRISNESRRHTVRALYSGEVAEVGDVLEGSFVRVGDRLGTLLTDGSVRVVADFSAAVAVGKIEPGQRASFKAHAFPWPEFGSLAIVVSRVAAEPRDGIVRVELAIENSDSSRISLVHGLTGSVEVEVARSSPARLLLRTFGKALRQQGPAL